MTPSMIRLSRIRLATNLDDHKLAAQVAAAEIGSQTQEELQEFILSQIRRMIFGETPGEWNADFVAQGIGTLESLTRGRFLAATCSAADEIGALVCVSGAASGGAYQVRSVDIANPTKMPAVGMLVEKPGATQGIVQRLGEVSIAGVVPGKRYWAGDDSKIAGIPPMPTAERSVLRQVAGVGIGAGVLSLLPEAHMVRMRFA